MEAALSRRERTWRLLSGHCLYPAFSPRDPSPLPAPLLTLTLGAHQANPSLRPEVSPLCAEKPELSKGEVMPALQVVDGRSQGAVGSLRISTCVSATSWGDLPQQDRPASFSGGRSSQPHLQSPNILVCGVIPPTACLAPSHRRGV